MSVIKNMGKEAPKKTKIESKAKSYQPDWAKRDAAMRLGGLFHDAAALTAGITQNCSLHDEGLDKVVDIFEKVLKRVIAVRKTYD